MICGGLVGRLIMVCSADTVQLIMTHHPTAIKHLTIYGPSGEFSNSRWEFFVSDLWFLGIIPTFLFSVFFLHVRYLEYWGTMPFAANKCVLSVGPQDLLIIFDLVTEYFVFCVFFQSSDLYVLRPDSCLFVQPQGHPMTANPINYLPSFSLVILISCYHS